MKEKRNEFLIIIGFMLAIIAMQVTMVGFMFSMNNRIADIQTKMTKADILQVETDLRADIARVETEIREVRTLLMIDKSYKGIKRSPAT